MNASEHQRISLKKIVIIIVSTSIVFIIGLVLLGLNLNEAFYSPSTGVRSIFSIITEAGDELFFIVMISFLYLGMDKRFAKRLLYGFLINTFINMFIKALVKDPRPITNMGQEEDYGFPSGHTQYSVAFWGYSIVYQSNHKQKFAIYCVSILLLILVPISRLIIGVHDLEDVIGGYVIGGISLCIYLIYEWKLMPNININWILKIFVGVACWMSLWVTSILILPENAEDFGLPCGLLVGVTIGLSIESRKIIYENWKLNMKKRIGSGIIGVLFALATYFILSFTLGEITEFIYIWRLVRYLLLGFLISGVYPLIMKLIFEKK